MHKFMELQELGLAEIVVMDGVGAEKFAEHAFNFADKLSTREKSNRSLLLCKCRVCRTWI